MPEVRDIEWVAYGVTRLHPMAMFLTLAAILFMLVSHRTRVIFALLLVATQIPHIQRVVIFDLDFSMFRLMLMIAWLRVLMRNEWAELKLTRIDHVFLFWCTSLIVIQLIQRPDFGTVVYRAGFALDTYGSYFLARCCIRSRRDVEVVVRDLVGISVLVAAALAYEYTTQNNLFHSMGAHAPELRDGRLRCSAALGHAILVGSLGASLVPLFIGLWFSKPSARSVAGLGIGCGIAIVLFSGSSGPVLSLAAGFLAWGCWFLRHQLRLMLLGISGLIVVIHFARQKPVWHLIGRLSELMGGTGYHRVRLIDQTVFHWKEWVLIGTNSSARWGYGLQDTTNWYIQNAQEGGLLTLIGFVSLSVFAYKSIGTGLHRARERPKTRGAVRLRNEMFVWGLGCSLVSHSIAWISVSYFGTMQNIFFIQLAATVGVAAYVRGRQPPLARSAIQSRDRTAQSVRPKQADPRPRQGLSGLLRPRRKHARGRTDPSAEA